MKRGILGASVAFAVVFPLLVLAASPGRLLPIFPRYRYEPLAGDTYGYYYCVREILVAPRRHPLAVALAVVLAVVLVLVARRVVRDRTWRLLAWWWALGVVAAALAAAVRFSGAPQFGWPLVWSVPMVPLRVVGLVGPNAAFVPGLVLSLACNVATIVAAYSIGWRGGLRPQVAGAGAALVAFWPLLSPLTGPKAGWNGQWQDYLGVSNYTEPLSTALVTVSLALLLRREAADRFAAAGAGGLLGLATLVRVSNALIAGVALVWLVYRRAWGAAAAFASASLAWAAAVAFYWPKGYPKLGPPTFPRHPFALAYAGDSWAHSYLWHPAVLAVLVPLAGAGALWVRRRAALLLVGAILATALFYTFYRDTPIHPRFLYVVLPSTFVLVAAGVEALIARVERR